MKALLGENLNGIPSRVASVLLLLSMSLFCHGKAFYVDPVEGVDDAGSGSSRMKPFRSLVFAIENVTSGDEIILGPGDYGSFDLQENGALFDSNVTIKGASGGATTIGATSISSASKLVANITFDGINFSDSISVSNASNVHIKNSLIETSPPWLGSEEAISRSAVYIRGSNNISISNVEITRAPIGVSFVQSDNVSITGSDIHDLTHDGIRIVSSENVRVVRNKISGLWDGVEDSEASWSKHCDGIHIYISGAATEEKIVPNKNVLISGNALFNISGQAVQFNIYSKFDEPKYWNQSVVVENNIFGTVKVPMVFNNATPVSGLVFRHNLFLPHTSEYHSPYADSLGKSFTTQNSGFRTSAETTGLEIYNNIFVNPPSIAGGTDYYDYNIIQNFIPGSAFPRFTFFADFDALYATSDPNNLKLRSGSVAIASGILRDPGVKDRLGNSRGDYPDIGPVQTSVPSYSDPSQERPENAYSRNIPVAYVDDFEDGNLLADAYLNSSEDSGIEWRQTPLSQAAFTIQRLEETGSNWLSTPLKASQGRSYLAFSLDQPWKYLKYSFDVINKYVPQQSGAALYLNGVQRYILIDLGSQSIGLQYYESGKLVKAVPAPAIAIPPNSKYRVEITAEVEDNSSLKVFVAVRSIESDELVRTASALFKQVAGNDTTFSGVGFFHKNLVDDYRLFFDNVAVSSSPRPEPPSSFRLMD
ncbi:right-handed parallel beta-helix repeat-containing protein [Allohahella marinimesophila]|uniref:Right handed beta helix domain-containing protein n=1 Tax=Allohahella marinimesophila TaxID=1054972 RepID=A0ABP7P8T3_9GAMM